MESYYFYLSVVVEGLQMWLFKEGYFVDKVEVGDVIVANREFDTVDNPSVNFAHFQMPSFMTGKQQLGM